MRKWLFIALGLLALQASSVESAEPKYPFVTSAGAVLCPDYVVIKDAKAALAAGDRSWFEKTGCIQAQGGLRVVLIEAPLVSDGYGGRRPSSGTPWRGRVYPPDDEANGATVYFDPWEISTYAFATIPYPVSFPSTVPGLNLPTIRDVWSGDKPVRFRTTAEAEQWYTKNIDDSYKAYIPRAVINEDGTIKLLLGPTAYGLLEQVCSHGKPSCHVLGQLPR